MTTRIASLILLLEGFVSVSAEILILRAMIPYVGSTVAVTSLVVAVVLGCLALGYERGGRLGDDALQRLRRRLLLAAVLLSVVLSPLLLDTLYAGVFIPLGVDPLLSLSLYLVVLVAPMIYLMGHTLPVMSNYLGQHGVPRSAGRALFLSTAGSVLGALVTSLALIGTVGVSGAVSADVLVLALMLALLAPGGTRARLMLLCALPLLAVCLTFDVWMERLDYGLVTPYASYRVITARYAGRNGRIMFINNGASSFDGTASGTAFPYMRYMQKILFRRLHYRHRHILVIGAGGFTFSDQGTRGNRVTYVDVDPAIKSYAQRRFLHHPIHGRFIAEGARPFLRSSHQRWDAIVLDAFSSRMQVPWQLTTRQFYRSLHRHLKSGGYLLINGLIDPDFADRFSRRSDATLRSVFPWCLATPMQFTPGRVTNVVYVCHKMRPGIGPVAIYGDRRGTQDLDIASHVMSEH